MAAFVPLVALTAYAMHASASRSGQDAQRALELQRALKARELDAWFNARLHEVALLTAEHRLRSLEGASLMAEGSTQSSLPLAQAANVLNAFLRDRSEFSYAALVSSSDSGRMLASTSDQDDGAARLIAEEVPSIARLKVSQGSVHVSAPVRCIDHDGRDIIAVLVARLDLEGALMPALAQVRADTGVSEAEAAIFSADGAMLLATTREPMDAQYVKKALLGESAIATEDSTALLYGPLDSIDGALVVRLPRASLNGMSPGARSSIAAVGFGLAALGFLAARLLGQWAAGPLADAIHVSHLVRDGDLSARVGTVRHPELQPLADAIDYTAGELLSILEAQRRSTAITERALESPDAAHFGRVVLGALMEETGSEVGVFYLLSADEQVFDAVSAVGASEDSLRPIPVGSLEGELGRAAARREITRITDIPPDTPLKIKTLGVSILPREVLTVPLLIRGKVIGFLSLASVHGYDQHMMQALDLSTRTLALVLALSLEQVSLDALAHQHHKQEEALTVARLEVQEKSHALIKASDERASLRQQLKDAIESSKDPFVHIEEIRGAVTANIADKLFPPLQTIVNLSLVIQKEGAKTLSHKELGRLHLIERHGKAAMAHMNRQAQPPTVPLEPQHHAAAPPPAPVPEQDKTPSAEPQLAINNKAAAHTGLTLKDAIHKSLSRVSETAKAKGIALSLSIPEGSPAPRADMARVSFILKHLLDNSIGHTEQGTINISLAHTDEYVSVTVTDTGAGFDPKELQGRPAGAEGGLVASLREARAMGGRLGVRSYPGKGTSIALYLPLERMHTRARRILFVRGHEDFAVQVRKVLEDEGYLVEVVRGGHEGIEALRTNPPHGVVLDVKTSAMVGMAMLEAIGAHRPLRNLPVLVLTPREIPSADIAKSGATSVRQLVHHGSIIKDKLLAMAQEHLGGPVVEEAHDA